MMNFQRRNFRRLMLILTLLVTISPSLEMQTMSLYILKVITEEVCKLAIRYKQVKTFVLVYNKVKMSMEPNHRANSD